MYDLTVPEGERASLNIREATGKGIFLEGVSEMEVTTTLKLIQRALGGSNKSLLIVLKHLYYNSVLLKIEVALSVWCVWHEIH